MSDATFEAAKAKIGETGIVDVLGAAGYYQVVSMFTNVDRYALANASQRTELKYFAQPLP